MSTGLNETELFLPPLKDVVEGATIAFPPSTVPERGEGVALVAGAGPHLSSETHSLRQVRLRAAAIFLIGSLGLFLAWRLTFATPDLWPLNVSIMTGVAVALGLLYDPRPIPSGRLKALEFAIFGLMGIFLSAREYFSLVLSAGDAMTLLATVRGSLIGTILLMFTYSMLIPNTWRSAAKVVIPIAMIPLAAKVALFLVHPVIFRSFNDAATGEMISENILFMVVATFLSIYGTHVLNELRSEVFTAKQLNQYRLVKLIGAGGMGDVYLAEHRMMKRPCALKLIRPERATDPRSLARFTREVQATSKLSHLNTIEIYDYGQTDDGIFYYVMEFLPGLSLEDLIAEHGPMPPGRVIFLIRQACGALAEAHASGLIHRDLKPANIFAAQRGGRFDVAKLLDFGLVKDISDKSDDPRITREFTVQGTPLYMSTWLPGRRWAGPTSTTGSTSTQSEALPTPCSPADRRLSATARSASWRRTPTTPSSPPRRTAPTSPMTLSASSSAASRRTPPTVPPMPKASTAPSPVVPLPPTGTSSGPNAGGASLKRSRWGR